MSETQEAPSPGQRSRLHKHTLKPLQNGYSHARLTVQPPSPADSDTRKIPASVSGQQSSHLNGDQQAQHAHLDGHHAIKEQETLKVPVARSDALPRKRNGAQVVLLAVAAYPLRRLLRLRRVSRPAFAAVIVVPIIVLLLAGSLEYLSLQQPFDNEYGVSTVSGAVQWQWPTAASMRPLVVDGQGSLAVESVRAGEQRLVALGSDGREQWKVSFTSSSISVPAVSGESALIAAGTPLPSSGVQDVQRPLVLYQVNRATGIVEWQQTIATAAGQPAAVLGASDTFAYVAIVQPGAASPGAELEAVSRSTGALAWKVSEPAQGDGISGDAGTLLVQGAVAYWQAAGTVYAIDAASGQIAWQTYIPENEAQALSSEEARMLVAGNALIVERSFAYHALSSANGTELWSIPNPAQEFGVQPSTAGIVADGATLIVYGGGQIDAVEGATRRILWEQKQLDGIQRVMVARDGKLLYVVLSDSVEGNQPTQALVALDARNGGARWTFQPSAQVTFLPLLPGGAAYTPGALLAAVCLAAQPSCSQPFLYALNPGTGATLWRVSGTSIGNIALSSDGGTVMFRRASSGWLDLLARIHNS